MGEEYLKNPQLNKRAFVCMDSKGPERYIEGFSDLTSPPLSMPSSAKPSAAKDDINQSNQIQTTNNLPINNKESNNKGRKPKSAIKQYNINTELMDDIKDHIRKPSTTIKLPPKVPLTWDERIVCAMWGNTSKHKKWMNV